MPMAKRRRHSDEERPAARHEEVSEAELLAYLARAQNAQSVREIASGMELRHWGRRALPKVLSQLKRRGDVEEMHGRFRLSGRKPERKTSAATPAPAGVARSREDESRAQRVDANLIAGRLLAHRDGYGFVVPEKPLARMEGDLFIPASGMGDAMHGDRVLARIARRHPDGRFEGRIEKVAARENPTVVGLFRYGAHENVVLPYETRIAHEIIIPPGEELTPALREKLQLAPGGNLPASRRLRLPELDGAVVDAELTRYPRGGSPPMGRVVEILGRHGEMGVDVEIVIRKHHLPHVFGEEVMREASRIAPEVRTENLAGRRDFRHLPIVTIDGETAKDFDDAVHVARREGGGFELQVHIADVAHYVRRATELDKEARLRGTSVYF